MAYVRIKLQEIELLKKIGCGGFSTVFEARWNCSNEVCHKIAAKRLNKVDMQEVEVLSTLYHPNIVKLIGVAENRINMYLILELCKGGSLWSFLGEYRAQNKRLSTQQVFDFALQAAKPIQYLNQMNVVHKDAKSPNYLISYGNVLKLADFGLARNIACTVSKASERACFPWMAPELLRDGVLSPKYDIFSYGVVVWEIVTTEVPFGDADPLNIIWRICNNNERCQIPSDCPKALADLMRKCWHTDWKRRPSIDDIVQILSSPSLLLAGDWALERVFGGLAGPAKLLNARDITVNTTNGDAAVANYSDAQVKVCSKEGQYKHNLQTKKGQKHGSKSAPWNAIVNSEGNYYVTDMTRFVKVYNTAGVYTHTFVTVSPDPKPSDRENTSLCGLAIDDKDQLLVGDVCRKYISRHRADGSHMASIKIGIGPHFLAVTSQETVIVSHWSNAVNVIDINTGQQLKIVEPPVRKVQDWKPWGLCCYDGIMYICNHAMAIHGICCFSVSGEYLRSIATSGSPRAITYDKDSNKLLVVLQDKVAVYGKAKKHLFACP